MKTNLQQADDQTLNTIVSNNSLLFIELVNNDVLHTKYGHGHIYEVETVERKVTQIKIIFPNKPGKSFYVDFTPEAFLQGKISLFLSKDSLNNFTSKEWIADSLQRLSNEAYLQQLKKEKARRERELRTQQEKEAIRQQQSREQAARQEKLRQEEKERQERILEESRQQERIRLRELKLRQLREMMYTDFLGIEDFYTTSCDQVVSANELAGEKAAFVTSWIQANIIDGINSEVHPPNAEQAAAIAAVNGNVQVVARAGSGKTTTVVNRTLFLIQHCGVKPEHILILAFNRKAVAAIQTKLLEMTHPALAREVDFQVGQVLSRSGKTAKKGSRTKLIMTTIDALAIKNNIHLPHVMTFHSLAHAIVHPEETLLYDDEDSNSLTLSRTLQGIIDEYLQITEHKQKIRTLMLHFFKEDWTHIIEKGLDRDKENMLKFRRSLPNETLGGEYVKSYGEKAIANFLFEHDINYKYERNHWWDGINYRPDFTLFKNSERGKESGIIIEYFGLMGDPDYDEMTAAKRRYWEQKKRWSLIEITPVDVAAHSQDDFYTLLRERLKALDMPCNRLSDDAIWQRLRHRAIDRFTTAVVGFIGRCGKRSLTPRLLGDLIKNYKPRHSLETTFFEIARVIHASYLERLAAVGEDDFDGLMQRAATAVASGQIGFANRSRSGDLSALRFIAIDEFQDFSDLFCNLIGAIQKKNPQVGLYCVGDDWQAINAFAGSDLKFYDNFSKYLGNSSTIHLTTNFRSAKRIVDIGNTLMSGHGKPATAAKSNQGHLLVADLSSFAPTDIEKERHVGDIFTPAILRVVNAELAADRPVVILCRRNALPWYIHYTREQNGQTRGLERYLEHLRRFFPPEQKKRVTISTTHKYKGLEHTTVILADLVEMHYPLIHPNWIFTRIFGDTPEKITRDEQRLLYVALTRAIERLILVTEHRRKSPFLKQLENNTTTDELCRLDWHLLPPACPPQDEQRRFSIRIRQTKEAKASNNSGTYPIKDKLSACRYTFHTIGKFWEKISLANEFSIEQLQSEIWSYSANCVAVHISDETENQLAHYQINNGRWLRMNDTITYHSPTNSPDDDLTI